MSHDNCFYLSVIDFWKSLMSMDKYRNKEVIILPSFLSISIGSPVNNYQDYGYEDGFSIIPKRVMLNFKVYVMGEDKIYDFGRIKKLFV